MRSCLLFITLAVLCSHVSSARAGAILVEPRAGLLQSYGPANEDDGPYQWQDNRSPGMGLELGYGWGPHDVTVGAQAFLHNHPSFLVMGMYRHHFGPRQHLHLFASAGLGVGCMNHRDYFEPGEHDTCSGGWQSALGGGISLPLSSHLALTGELLSFVSFPEKIAFTPSVAVSAAMSF